MGGLDDSECEPPLKHVKVPSRDLKKLLDDSSHTEPLSVSLGDLMARPLSFQGDREWIGALLEEESGIWLHSSAVNLFMQQVLDGKWDASLATLHDIDLSDETIVKSASFLILEQKFLDLLKEGKVMAALGTLRNEIMPLSINVGRVHDLAACIISLPHCVVFELSSQNNATNSRSRFLEKLQILFPAAVMVPERRLEHLVEQALDVQRDGCVFHNTLDSELSLYSDHQCGRNQIPSQTLQVRYVILVQGS
ncbi:hypothetical protein F0562_036194 [Nyssa sinensis]|uniref:CTLH domain-containing protein n=1 Tax=Nyssa sinensis TaxID=561372 RepID=A0A5J5AF87_9ASTE|nr:hypothetical protein F0562_036194 [Nyssa sinensis]